MRSQLPLAELVHHWFKQESVNNLNKRCLTLTYDLDLQSQASQGQGRPSCQKITLIGQTVQTGVPTDKQTDTRVLPNVLAPLLRGR